MESVRSKYLYKIFLILIKYTPVVIILTEIISSVLAYLELDYYWVGCISYTSAISLVHLYVSSYVFRFCYLYRWCLNFILLHNSILFYDTYFKIQMPDVLMLRLYLFILGVALLTFIKFKIKDAKHNKIRVRGIS